MGNTRTLDRNDRGMLKWRLDELAIGDTLDVPQELASYGQTYNYVKSRGSVLGLHFLIERMPSSTAVRRVAQPTHVGPGRDWKRPRPSGTPCDWGVIKRTIGQKNWRWPFEVMEVGDEFRVASEDLPAGDIRQRVYNYAWKNQVHFSVQDSPITAPGYTLVQRVIEPKVRHDKTAWSVVQQRVLECYETEDKDFAVDYPYDKRVKLDYVQWFDLLEIGNRVSVTARQIATPHRSSYIFELPSPDTGELGRFALDLFEDHFTVERVEMDMSHELWEEIKQARIEEALA